MAVCLTCKNEFLGGEQFCPKDGTPLQTQAGGDPLLGRLLSGRYRLESRLGQGGMGAVYRAHHILMDKAVAVKVLRHELSSDAEAVARFHREARSASRLDHEHIIRVTDFGQSDDGQLFLAMELLDGESLAEVIHKGPLPWRRAATIIRDAALGLAHAHEQGIIHRDLKPENIILARRAKSSRQLVKVLDFGLAKLMHEAGAAAPDASITRTGVVFGTPEYMSPEQAEGALLDHRADLYALGVIGYQMVTGEVPFSAPTFLALITKAVHEAPEAPSRRRPDCDLPQELEALILRCLAKKPADRPQSAEEMVDALELLLAVHPGPASAERSLPLREPSGSVEAAAPRPAATPPELSAVAPAIAGAGSSLAHDAAALAATSPHPTSEPSSGLALGADSDGDEGALPPRRRWPYAAMAFVFVGGAVALAPRYLRPAAVPSAQPAERDPMATAKELLARHHTEDALSILKGERLRRNTPLLQRLLSEAHVAKNNRLQALGHMYLAQALARGGPEEQPLQLRLAQLLLHLGYQPESCRTVDKLLGGAPPLALRQEAESLVRTLRCKDR